MLSDLEWADAQIATLTAERDDLADRLVQEADALLDATARVVDLTAERDRLRAAMPTHHEQAALRVALCKDIPDHLHIHDVLDAYLDRLLAASKEGTE